MAESSCRLGSRRGLKSIAPEDVNAKSRQCSEVVKSQPGGVRQIVGDPGERNDHGSAILVSFAGGQERE